MLGICLSGEDKNYKFAGISSYEIYFKVIGLLDYWALSAVAKNREKEHN